ncbi:hypothetical protein B0H13DRAFT_1931364 [Mycena leptocephala]|nr:hypothetical protein B0H13DRAFT_1931364 [Mycena leptocephala]
MSWRCCNQCASVIVDLSILDREFLAPVRTVLRYLNAPLCCSGSESESPCPGNLCLQAPWKGGNGKPDRALPHYTDAAGLLTMLSRTAGVERERRLYGEHSAAESADSGEAHGIESRGAFRGYVAIPLQLDFSKETRIGSKTPSWDHRTEAYQAMFFFLKFLVVRAQLQELQHEEVKDAEAAGWQNSDTKFQNGENKYSHPIRTWKYWYLYLGRLENLKGEREMVRRWLRIPAGTW